MGRNGALKTVIDSFDLATGRKIAGKYEILSLLGAGWEGEVYKICEVRTGIDTREPIPSGSPRRRR